MFELAPRTKYVGTHGGAIRLCSIRNGRINLNCVHSLGKSNRYEDAKIKLIGKILNLVSIKLLYTLFM